MSESQAQGVVTDFKAAEEVSHRQSARDAAREARGKRVSFARLPSRLRLSVFGCRCSDRSNFGKPLD